MDLQLCYLKVFFLFLSPSRLIDMLLLCSLPTDHTQASSVWTESSVGLEKSTAAPPGAMFPAGLQVGSRACWQEPPPSGCGQQQMPGARCARVCQAPAPPRPPSWRSRRRE